MRELRVSVEFGPGDRRHVGVLAEDQRVVWFEFDSETADLEISPYALPRKRGPLVEHLPKPGVPIPGVFADARPDGWGLRLLHRAFQSRGIARSSVSPLDELAYLGRRTMGALTFEPCTGPQEELADAIALGALAEHAQRVYDGDVAEVLPALLRAGGPSGGARPKALIGLPPDGGSGVVFGEGDLPAGWSAWLVKFPRSEDDHDVGRRELAWMRMAAAAKLQTPDCQTLSLGGALAPAFAVRRFDRPGEGRRLHMLSAAGALDVDFRTALTDYTQLLRLTSLICAGDYSQALAVYRLAVFNVAAVNEDDHLKNISFLCDGQGQWALSPAYDLTYAPQPRGERATLVAGAGRDVERSHLVALAADFGLRKADVDRVLDEVLSAVAQVGRFLGDAGCRGPVSRAAERAVLASLSRLS